MITLVTGGCSGLGKSLTLNLLSRGYEVYALYNTSEDNARKMENEFSNLKCFRCDITDEESVSNFFDRIGTLDIVINNAGISIDNNYLDKTLVEFMKVVKTNLGGTFLVSKYASRHMNKNGVIINISSDNTLGNHNPLSMDYDASKSGINMLTLDFKEALETSNIKVIAIAPGWINTDSVKEMNPDYLKEEMKRNEQIELLDPDKLSEKIIDIGLSEVESGSIIRIKEL